MITACGANYKKLEYGQYYFKGIFLQSGGWVGLRNHAGDTGFAEI